jgi:hypothetical protein
MQVSGGWAAPSVSLIALSMKTVTKYLALLAVMPMASNAVLAESRATPLTLAQQITNLIDSGPYDPSPPVPGSDIVQRDAR